MARSRNIKPALFRNEILGVADPLYTLLFQSLWLIADRDGRLEDRPLRIKVDTFPYRDGIDVDAMLTWLHEKGFIIRYTFRENRYIQICNFAKHQNPHKNEAKSEIPEYSNGCTTSEKIGTTSEKIGSDPADSLNLIPDSGFLIADCPTRSATTASADGQAYLDRITQHDRANQQVTMSTEWKPSEQFQVLMMRAGLTADRLTDEILAKFVIYHNGTSKPQNKWESALVAWCKREQHPSTNTAPNAPKNGHAGGSIGTNQPHPLAFTEENRPKVGPYALFKPEPKKIPNDPNDPEWIKRQAALRSILK